jgi:hypothetical protein
VRDRSKDREILSDLNRNYVRSVDAADTAWFDANLASDFLNTNPDGALIDRNAFIVQIGRGSSVKNIREHDVIIRILVISRSHGPQLRATAMTSMTT